MPALGSFERRDVRFPSAGGECAGWLYVPGRASERQRVPIIVMAHGFGGIKEQRLDAFAERFADRGYAVLVFDYRHFGQSTGEPRNLVSVPAQLEDWRSAVAHARTITWADPERVILWGTSFSGGHVLITAADDAHIAATISQCPFTDGMAAGMRMPRGTMLKLWRRAFQDRRAARRGLPPVEVGIVGSPGDVAIMTAPDSLPGFDALIKESAEIPDVWPHRVPARVMFSIPGYIPGKQAAKIVSPLLVCICEHDSVTPAKQTQKLVAQAPRGEARTYDAGHFEIYLGEKFETVIRDQIDFLERVVPISAPEGAAAKDTRV